MLRPCRLCRVRIGCVGTPLSTAAAKTAATFRMSPLAVPELEHTPASAPDPNPTDPAAPEAIVGIVGVAVVIVLFKLLLLKLLFVIVLVVVKGVAPPALPGDSEPERSPPLPVAPAP